MFLNQSGVENPPLFDYNVVPGQAIPQLPSTLTTTPATPALYVDDRPQAAGTMRHLDPLVRRSHRRRTERQPRLVARRCGVQLPLRYGLPYDNCRRRQHGRYRLELLGQARVLFAPVILNTNNLPAISNQLVGFETALVYGPFSAQGEVFGDYIEQPGGHEVTFTGGYGYLSYFLTGENRCYNRKTGCFDRVRPFTNFFRVRTCDGDVATGWALGSRLPRDLRRYARRLAQCVHTDRRLANRPGPGDRPDAGPQLVSQSVHEGHGQLYFHNLRPDQQRRDGDRARGEVNRQSYRQHVRNAGAVRFLNLNLKTT